MEKVHSFHKIIHENFFKGMDFMDNIQFLDKNLNIILIVFILYFFIKNYKLSIKSIK